MLLEPTTAYISIHMPSGPSLWNGVEGIHEQTEHPGTISGGAARMPTGTGRAAQVAPELVIRGRE